MTDSQFATTICLLLCLVSGIAGAGAVLVQKDEDKPCFVELRDQNLNVHILRGKCHE